MLHQKRRCLLPRVQVNHSPSDDPKKIYPRERFCCTLAMCTFTFTFIERFCCTLGMCTYPSPDDEMQVGIDSEYLVSSTMI